MATNQPTTTGAGLTWCYSGAICKRSDPQTGCHSAMSAAHSHAYSYNIFMYHLYKKGHSDFFPQLRRNREDQVIILLALLKEMRVAKQRNATPPDGRRNVAIIFFDSQQKFYNHAIRRWDFFSLLPTDLMLAGSLAGCRRRSSVVAMWMGWKIRCYIVRERVYGRYLVSCMMMGASGHNDDVNGRWTTLGMMFDASGFEGKKIKIFKKKICRKYWNLRKSDRSAICRADKLE